MTHILPNHETECQQSVKNFWSCILGNQGFTQINELITELLTAIIVKNTTYNRKNTDSKIINVADCTIWKKRLLAVEYLNLTINNYPTAKTRSLYQSTDGPAGRPTDNPPNLDRLGDFLWTVPKFTVRVYWQPGLSICERFGPDPDPDPKWRSGTVANTNHKRQLRQLPRDDDRDLTATDITVEGLHMEIEWEDYRERYSTKSLTETLTEWRTKESKSIAERHTELNAKPHYQRSTKWLPRNKRIFYRSCLPKWPQKRSSETLLNTESRDGEICKCTVQSGFPRAEAGSYRGEYDHPVWSLRVRHRSMTYCPRLMQLAHSTTLKWSPASRMKTDGYYDARSESSHHCPKSRQGAVAMTLRLSALGRLIRQ